MVLDVGDIQTKLLPRVEEDADREIRVPDALGVASNPPAKLPKGIRKALVYEPVDLGKEIASLRLRRPRLQPADVPESEISVDLIAILNKDTWNLTELLKAFSRQLDAGEADIVSLRNSVQYLECREPSISLDDRVCTLFALLDNQQRLLPKEAVVPERVRKLLQRPLRIEIPENFGLGLSVESFRKPWILIIEIQLVEGEQHNGSFLRVCVVH